MVRSRPVGESGISLNWATAHRPEPRRRPTKKITTLFRFQRRILWVTARAPSIGTTKPRSAILIWPTRFSLSIPTINKAPRCWMAWVGWFQVFFLGRVSLRSRLITVMTIRLLFTPKPGMTKMTAGRPPIITVGKFTMAWGS